MTLSLYEWKELKKTIPLFEDKEPELMLNKHENEEKESRNVVIDRKFTKKYWLFSRNTWSTTQYIYII